MGLRGPKPKGIIPTQVRLFQADYYLMQQLFADDSVGSSISSEVRKCVHNMCEQIRQQRFANPAVAAAMERVDFILDQKTQAIPAAELASQLALFGDYEFDYDHINEQLLVKEKP